MKQRRKKDRRRFTRGLDRRVEFAAAVRKMDWITILLVVVPTIVLLATLSIVTLY